VSIGTYTINPPATQAALYLALNDRCDDEAAVAEAEWILI
jgi:hypothetical protein